MRRKPKQTERLTLRGKIFRLRWLFWSVALFSALVNLLMLTGPIFMLQVYDRVLTSRSEATLAALFALVAALFLAMGLLEYARGRVLARAGARFQSELDEPVFIRTLAVAKDPENQRTPATGLRDLEAIQRLLSGPAPLALFDAPWAIVYLTAIFLFHPWLGWMALFGGGVLVTLALLNEVSSRKPQRNAGEARAYADLIENEFRRHAEPVAALGMVDAATNKWVEKRDKALETQILASDRNAVYGAASKTVRLFLQSAMLALGALLAVRGEITPGVMIAASILTGRALAPVEQAIAQWSPFQKARDGWRRLNRLLDQPMEEPPEDALPTPKGKLEVEALAVGPPRAEKPTLQGLTFKVDPGEALGVIGPSGAGKSTLIRALAGVWPPRAGEIRLDGATLGQYAPSALGRSIGYLPQQIDLLDGTVAENIARLDPDADRERVRAAADLAGATELILKLSDGYETLVGAGGSSLSGGQKARIGLARALYGDPALVLLDEPNAHLDALGEQALRAAIDAVKARGGAVVIVAHRPSAIAVCSRLLMLDAGAQRAFGDRDEVLQKTVANAPQLVAGQGVKS
ncbi:MAG: type I secretion system permease/ATPase [Pseudomonadota bacterium]